ncbi:hypothetical protein P691DRAFT_768414 [Macrolepiota fuliginosa MF-IS2]|uniref:Uncharacterized protein n=1 Tax=Macrolepiota fuliginosa MF-IS2 TaxID=1400762 RepID=A0A9P5WW83_9AGAR|nr:hypothetical protein P691DRAFT_768414 [Macrolepiota fuliginosa MF-IS2]
MHMNPLPTLPTSFDTLSPGQQHNQLVFPCSSPQFPQVNDPFNNSWWIHTSNMFAIEFINEKGPVQSTIHDLGLANRTNHPANVQVLTNTTSTLPTIPQSEKAKLWDLELQCIQAFLDDLKQPPDMTNNAFKHFIQQAARFFIKDGRLWRKDPKNKHKIVIAK